MHTRFMALSYVNLESWTQSREGKLLHNYGLR